MKSRYFRVTPIIIIIGITHFPLRYVHTISYVSVYKKRNLIVVPQRGAQ